MSLRIHGNRLLKTLPGPATRPTAARVREAIFNIWQPSTIEGCRWLDLCSGSGSMGAEALSRGAVQVVGIEQAGRACAVIRENWTRIAKPPQTFQIIQGDVTKQVPKLAGQKFDRIYFDPPYAGDLYLPVMQAIAHHHLLHPEGELAMEHSPERWSATEWTQLEQAIAPLKVCRQKIYGGTIVTFWALS